MPSSSQLFWGPTHTNCNVICAIDIRVGGDDPVSSDLLEIAVLPVNHSYKLHPVLKMFQVKIRPAWKVDRKVAKLSSTNIGDFLTSSFDSVGAFALFERWVRDMEMKSGKKLIPLVWDWGHVKPRLQNWMGELSFDHYFLNAPRDCVSVLNFMNDRSHLWGEDQEFKHPTFAQFLTHTGTELIDTNSVTSNAKALIDAYRKVLGTYMPGHKSV